NSEKDELIPSNTGLLDGNIESQISSYNSLLLKRNSYLEANSASNPIVEDLNTSLIAMHRNILRAIDNVITGYNIKISNLRREESNAIDKASRLPSQQRVMLS